MPLDELISLGGADLGIYGKNDKLKSEKAKTDLEAYFNSYITNLQTAVQNTAARNDW